jgi:hypothetical protein
MMISIARDGVRKGDWTRDEVSKLYKNKHLLPTDFYWIDGMTDWKTLESFFLEEVITAGCRQILQRPPTEKELATWENRLQVDHSVLDMISAFVTSDEFNENYIKPFDAETAVKNLYLTLLGREADPWGLQHWAPALKEQGPRLVIDSIFHSPEYINQFGKSVVPHAAGSPAVAYGPFGPTISNVAAPRSARGRLIAVSCVCQSASMADALQNYLPDDTLLSLPIHENLTLEQQEHFASELANTDIWVTNSTLVQRPNFSERPGFRPLDIPFIVFPAFHPDFCHIIKVSDQLYPHPRYASAIGVWAYNKGLGISDAVKLFNRQSYAGLGYFDLWNPSVSELRKAFTDFDFDFDRFILAVKRQGAFMYTISHPKVSVIIELAKQVAAKLGASDSHLKKTFSLRDGLTDYVWPIYPEIADEFSLPHGSYDWKIDNTTWLEGIESYLEKSFQEFADQNIPRGGLVLQHRDEALYDRILGPQVSATK